MITANEAPRDQRLTGPATYQPAQPPEVVKKARKQRKARASQGSKSTHRSHSTTSSRSRNDSLGSPSSRPPATSSASHSSHRSQLVDLVVEDREAEAEEQVHVQRAFGSTTIEPEHKHFRLVNSTVTREMSDSQSLQLTLNSRRPSGEPIKDEAPSGAAEREDNADGDEPKPRTWSYGDLEENVWDR